MLEEVFGRSIFICRQDLGEGRILLEKIPNPIHCLYYMYRLLGKSKEQEASGFKSLCCVEAIVTNVER